MEKYKGNTIHPSAIIHPTVKMGIGNFIGAYTILEENVVLGDNNYIGPHCIIGDVGESIKFFESERKGVIIGNNNRFTKQVTVDSGTVNPTVIKNNTLWLKNAHTAHLAAAGSDPAALIREHAERISYVHLKGFQRQPFAFTPIDRGDVPTTGIIAALEDIGFDGWLCTELDAWPDPLEGAKASMTLVNRKTGTLGYWRPVFFIGDDHHAEDR